MSNDPRNTIHNATVQGLPPTTPTPKKKLSHTVKSTPSAPITGVFAPILRRAPVPRKRGLLRRFL